MTDIEKLLEEHPLPWTAKPFAIDGVAIHDARGGRTGIDTNVWEDAEIIAALANALHAERQKREPAEGFWQRRVRQLEQQLAERQERNPANDSAALAALLRSAFDAGIERALSAYNACRVTAADREEWIRNVLGGDHD